MTASTFGIHQSTASRVILEVCIAIINYLGPKESLPSEISVRNETGSVLV